MISCNTVALSLKVTGSHTGWITLILIKIEKQDSTALIALMDFLSSRRRDIFPFIVACEASLRQCLSPWHIGTAFLPVTGVVEELLLTCNNLFFLLHATITVEILGQKFLLALRNCVIDQFLPSSCSFT